jgi:DNA polymerase-1
LQGAGAIVMKKALVLLDKKIKAATIDARFVVNVHDEFELEVAEPYAELVGKMAVDSMKEAGEYFKLRCPLTGEYKIGTTWRETH